MKAGDVIKKARDTKGWSQLELAKRAKISPTTIVNAETGKKRTSGAVLIAVAYALGLPSWEDVLIRYGNARPFSYQHRPEGGIPVFEEVPAGPGNFDPSQLGEDSGFAGWYIDEPFRQALGVEDPLAFAVTVRGESMQPDYKDGDIVICSPTAEQEAGMEAVFRLADGDCGLKIIQWADDDQESLLLVPRNPQFRTRQVHREEIVRLARVVAKIERRK